MGFPIFVSWNLKGALPGDVIESLRRERQRLLSLGPPSRDGADEWSIRVGKILFARADRHLGSAVAGSVDLTEPAAASIIEESIRFGSPERYALYSWCIMSNHVHVLLKPIQDLRLIMKAIKGATARRINRLHARSGVFWQDESYDHWARDEAEMFRIIHYIEDNPVSVGLCERAGDWPWSSARFRPEWPSGLPLHP